MFAALKKFFQPPLSKDPETNRRAQNLHTILIALLVIILSWVWYPIFVQGEKQIIVGLIVLGVILGMYALLKKGYVRLVSNVLALSLWLLVIGFMWAFGGVRNSGFSVLAIIVVIASLTIGARAGFFYAIASVLAGILLVLAENRNLLPPYAFEPNTTTLTTYSLLVVSIGLLLALAIRNINKALNDAERASRETRQALELLEKNSAELENRTIVLEQQNLALQMVAEVARISAQVKEQDALLNEMVQLLSTRLKIDHTAIFLADKPLEYAHLMATNTEEGKALQREGYKLPISATPFGFAIPESDAILCQVGKQSYYIARPISLADTKTNISYPIATSSQLLGLINIQTVSPEPLQIDPDTFRVVVTQIALSLENIRLVEQLQRQIREIRYLAQEAVESAWEEWQKRKVLGYAYNQLQILPAKEAFPKDVYALLKSGKSAVYTIASPRPRSRLVAPIVLRENVIGVIGYEDENPKRVWHESEIALLEAIAGRVSLALENSRLVAEAQQRAEQEKILSQITSRVRQTLDMETILQTTVAEIQKSFNLEEAEITLRPLPNEANA